MSNRANHEVLSMAMLDSLVSRVGGFKSLTDYVTDAYAAETLPEDDSDTSSNAVTYISDATIPAKNGANHVNAT